MTDKDKVKQAMEEGHVSVVDIGKLICMDPERVKVLMGDICYERHLEHKKWCEHYGRREMRPFEPYEIDRIIRGRREGKSLLEIANELDRRKGSVGVIVQKLKKEGRL